MKEFKDKEVELVFENCESMKIKCDTVVFNRVIEREKCRLIDDVVITIPNENNFIHNYWNYPDTETIAFNRILKYNDITHIYIDDIKYKVVCNGNNWQNNNYQKSHRNDEGDLIITISKSDYEKEYTKKEIGRLITKYIEQNIDIDFYDIISKFIKNYPYEYISDKCFIEILKELTGELEEDEE